MDKEQNEKKEIKLDNIKDIKVDKNLKKKLIKFIIFSLLQKFVKYFINVVIVFFSFPLIVCFIMMKRSKEISNNILNKLK